MCISAPKHILMLGSTVMKHDMAYQAEDNNLVQMNDNVELRGLFIYAKLWLPHS